MTVTLVRNYNHLADCIEDLMVSKDHPETQHITFTDDSGLSHSMWVTKVPDSEQSHTGEGFGLYTDNRLVKIFDLLDQAGYAYKDTVNAGTYSDIRFGCLRLLPLAGSPYNR